MKSSYFLLLDALNGFGKLFGLLLDLFLFFRFGYGKDKTDTVHAHDHCHIFYMVHFGD